MLGESIALRCTLEPTVERLGYELVYVALVESKVRSLRIFIDAPGGITLGDCERVSRQVSDVLDIEDVIGGEYTLEVSSPGLDRPLAKPEHFEGVKGKEIYIRMRGPHSGRRKFRGNLVEVESDAALLVVDGETYRLCFSDMRRANLVTTDPLSNDDKRSSEEENG